MKCGCTWQRVNYTYFKSGGGVYAEKNMSGAHCGFMYDTDGGDVVCTPTMNVCALGTRSGTKEGNIGVTEDVCREPLADTQAEFSTAEVLMLTLPLCAHVIYYFVTQTGLTRAMW
jgi:hypothetical protein